MRRNFKIQPKLRPWDQPDEGTYGDTLQASMGEWVLKSDLDRNGKVNLSDLAEIATEWLTELEWAE
jgi:hypothetical protein